MLYKDFQDLKLSALGLGMMRLPKNGSGDGDIDEAKAAEMVDYALKNGVNYFDTAYAYHGGQSEIVFSAAIPATAITWPANSPGMMLPTLSVLLKFLRNS